MMKNTRINFLLLAIIIITQLTACSMMVSKAAGKMAENLSNAVLNQNDPETVRDGAPAFLLMIDGLIEGDPDNGQLLFSGSRLYAAYATAFVDDKARVARLAEKALLYARRGLCVHNEKLCGNLDLPYKSYVASLSQITVEDMNAMYAYSSAWATWLGAHSDDWNAIAQIPKLRMTLEHLYRLQSDFEQGGIALMLAVLESQLPASLGGKPEKARAYFESALKMSQGQNLMVKVLYAKHYARLIFNQPLHDKLLNEVLASEVEVKNLTLTNTIAQQQAKKLLLNGKDFF